MVPMVLRNVAIAVSLLLTAPVLALSAGQATERPAFEVVSIRPIKPSLDGGFVLWDDVRVLGDRLQARNISALGLIRAAYGSDFPRRDQIIGAGGWIESERFDVDARASSALSETPAMAARMLQQVLEQRFQLRVRTDMREIPTLVLTHARTDRALKQGIRVSSQNCTDGSKVDAVCVYRPMAGNFSMRGRPIQTFVGYLSRPAYAGGAVVDETGITGLVDIDFQWTLDFRDLPLSTANLMTALREQLGLKLEGRHLMLPVLVIEHIDRPTAN
jgi:uncharacterized protein (TIGR03435 family)